MNNHIPEELLNEYLDNALDAPTRREIETHIAICTECRLALDELRLVYIALENMQDAPLPHNLIPTREISTEHSLPSVWKLALVVQAALTLALIVIFVTNFHQLANLPVNFPLYVPTAELRSINLNSSFLIPSFLRPSHSRFAQAKPFFPLHPSFFIVALLTTPIFWIAARETIATEREYIRQRATAQS